MKKNSIKQFIFFVALVLPVLPLLAVDYSSYNWSRLPFDSESFIDHSRMSGDKVYGFKVTVLSSYDSISSAQMWGLSEVAEIAVNCQNGTLQYLKTVWTERQMGRGKITHTEGPYQSFPVRNVLDGTLQRGLFKYMCR